jgi:hypothetical protein
MAHYNATGVVGKVSLLHGSCGKPEIGLQYISAFLFSL